MLKANDLVKRFGDTIALDGLNTEIGRGCIYGLVGPNGSGKSTLMRLMCGVCRPDGGSITLEGEPVFENIAAKDRILYLSDDLYFPPKSTVEELAAFYRGLYSGFSTETYQKLCGCFPLEVKKSLSTFSKGQRRQAALLAALCFVTTAPWPLAALCFCLVLPLSSFGLTLLSGYTSPQIKVSAFVISDLSGPDSKSCGAAVLSVSDGVSVTSGLSDVFAQPEKVNTAAAIQMTAAALRKIFGARRLLLRQGFLSFIARFFGGFGFFVALICLVVTCIIVLNGIRALFAVGNTASAASAAGGTLRQLEKRSTSFFVAYGICHFILAVEHDRAF